MDKRVPVNAQSLGQDASSGLSPDTFTSATSLDSLPDASPPPDSLRRPSSFPSAPRGPHRAGVNGAGSGLAAERFGLDWDSASASVRAVAAAACARVPEEWEVEGPGIALSLGDAADLDPALLEAMLGPDGLGGEALGPQFGQDGAADALRPGPVLAALTEQAVADVAFLTDDQVTGAMHAAEREKARAAWKETTLVAEYARRRAAQLAEAKAAGVPKGRRPGEFPDDELAAELLITRYQAAGRIEADLELTGRLPRTCAGMADGTISADRADTIAASTVFLSDEDAARADEILAAAAPGLRVDQLGRKAAALEMKLDPEAVRIRKEHARNTRQRVEVRRELSGNASLSGRELDTAQALASKAHIDAVAVKLRNYGGLEDPLSSIRARVFIELTQGRDPLDLIKPKRPPTLATGGPGTGIDDPGADDADNPDDDEPARRGPLRPGMTAPLPAAINLLVPIGSLLGWSAAPATANGIGLLDPAETRDLIQAASQHPEPAGAPRSSTPTAPPPPTPAPPASTPGTRHRQPHDPKRRRIRPRATQAGRARARPPTTPSSRACTSSSTS